MCEVLCFLKSSFKHTREDCETKRNVLLNVMELLSVVGGVYWIDHV